MPRVYANTKMKITQHNKEPNKLNKQEVFEMHGHGGHHKHNEDIACSVNECKHNCNCKQHCTLDNITVTKNQSFINSVEGTDCSNFCQK